MVVLPNDGLYPGFTKLLGASVNLMMVPPIHLLVPHGFPTV